MSILSRSIFLALLLTVCFLCKMETPAEARHRSEQVGDYEVVVYKEPNFKGPNMSFRLEPGMRQRLIQSINREWWKHFGKSDSLMKRWKGLPIGSMKVGYKIRVFVFEYSGFHSSYTNLRSKCNTFKPGLHKELYNWEGSIESMILCPFSTSSPVGVYLYTHIVEMNTNDLRYGECNRHPLSQAITTPFHVKAPESASFLPLPEKNSCLQGIYRNLTGMTGDRAVSIRLNGVKVELFKAPYLKGQRLILPGQGSRTRFFKLSDFNFQNSVLSARVFQDPPMSDQKRGDAPSSVRREAPPASSGQEQRSTPSKVWKNAPPASSEKNRRNDYCRQYADRALQQRSERIKQTGSAPTNDPVWSQDWNLHYNWCLQVSESTADKGSKIRQDWLDQHWKKGALPSPMRKPVNAISK